MILTHSITQFWISILYQKGLRFPRQLPPHTAMFSSCKKQHTREPKDILAGRLGCHNEESATQTHTETASLTLLQKCKPYREITLWFVSYSRIFEDHLRCGWRGSKVPGIQTSGSGRRALASCNVEAATVSAQKTNVKNVARLIDSKYSASVKIKLERRGGKWGAECNKARHTESGHESIIFNISTHTVQLCLFPVKNTRGPSWKFFCHTLVFILTNNLD